MDPKNSHAPDRVDYQEHPGDLTEVHAAIQREHPEPTAESTPVPMWLIATCGLAVCWAGLYLGAFNGGFKGEVLNELTTNASMIFGMEQKGDTGPVKPPEEDPLALGKSVYANCAACHQASGTGQGSAIPPLVGSEWVLGSEKRMAAILLKGIQGPLTVKGTTYNGVMPAWEGSLTDKKIAAVITYVRATWGNNAPPVSEAKIKAARAEYASHKTAMSEADLNAIPKDATLPDAAGGAPAAGPAAPATAAPANGASPAPAASAGGAAASAPTASQAPAAPAPAGPAGSANSAPAPAAGNAPATQGGAPAASSAPAAAASPEQIAAGKTVYMTCIPCHQATGAGLPPVFPPLTKSPYVNGSTERFIAMVLKGNVGPMTIDGKPYNNIMPPQEAVLDDKKVADVTTYVRNSFGNSAPAVTPEQVAAARAKFADRKTGWTQPELDAWKE